MFIRCDYVLRVRFFIINNIHVNACSVIYEEDEGFCRMQLSKPSALEHEVVLLPSQCIDSSALCHLTIQQQTELTELLNEYADCFSETPGICDSIEHKIIRLYAKAT